MIKVLYILNFAPRVNHFSFSSMMAAKELGFEFHIAGNWRYSNEYDLNMDELKYGIHIHQIDFMRNPFHPGNLKAYNQICDIMKNEHFDILHSNTPIGGALGRLAARKCHVPHVIYQAHGFHFYHGGPPVGWLLFYPIEKYLALITDVIVTINQEDYNLACHKLRPHGKGNVINVPGIGIDHIAFSRIEVDVKIKRSEMGVPSDAPVILSVGELNANKHHEIIIRSMPQIPKAHYLIAGQGTMLDELRELADRLSVSDRVHFLGYRDDVKQLYRVSDVFCLPSYREGLSASVMEAMASGLPVVCSDIRGNRDLITHEKGGYLITVDDMEEYVRVFRLLIQSPDMRHKMGMFNLNYIKNFGIDKVIIQMKTIYSDVLIEKGRKI